MNLCDVLLNMQVNLGADSDITLMMIFPSQYVPGRLGTRYTFTSDVTRAELRWPG
jgi:hypothetical protein